jgi:hypothetical protein
MVIKGEAKSKKKIVCSTCPYWACVTFSQHGETRQGECRCESPKANNLRGKRYWPITSEYEWCGRHPFFFIESISPQN